MKKEMKCVIVSILAGCMVAALTAIKKVQLPVDTFQRGVDSMQPDKKIE